MQSKLIVALFILVFVGGCGGNVENNYNITEVTPGTGGSSVAGQAGSSGHAGIAGSSGHAGNGGSVSTGGSAGSAGTGGTSGASGTGGTTSDGGVGGEAGSSGTGGAAGEAGSAGASGSENDGGTDAITGSTLTIGLMADPPSTVYVKKMQNVPALGVMVTSSGHDIMVGGLDMECRGSIHGGPFQATDCIKIVTSVAIYRGVDQVGLAWAPNTDGSLHFTPQLVVPGGSSVALTVKMSLASGVSSGQPFDRVAFGIKQVASATDLITQQIPQIALAPEVSTVQLSDYPIVAHTIRYSGTLKIEADAHPAAQIVVGGKDSWSVAASYKATAQYEAATIDYSSVIQDSLFLADDADIVAVAVASQGTIRGQTVLPASDSGCANADLTGDPIQVPKDGSTNIQVWVKYAAPMAGSAVNNAQHGVPRSGHQPRVGLSDSIMGGEWPSDYLGKFNVRTTGVTSGERLYADATGVVKPNAMTLRKAKPIITKQQLASNMLMNAQLDVFRFQVAADGPGVATKQFAFDVGAPTSGLTVSNLRLRRGASEMPTDQYTLVEAITGADLKAGSKTMDPGTGFRVIAAFTTEEVISGSGNIYTLSVVFSSVGSGGVFLANLAKDANSMVATGNLLNNDWYAPFAPSPFIFNIGQGPDQNGLGAWHVLGTQVWSDESELPHSAQPAFSSSDWISDKYLEDLTSSQILSN